MTSRERVLTALARRQPDRTPFAWGFGATEPLRERLVAWCREGGAVSGRGLDWERLRLLTGDTLVIEPDYVGPALGDGQPVYTGIWGITTTDVSYGAGSYQEFTGHPLAGMENLANLEAVRWPITDWFDYGALAAQVRRRDPEHAKAWQASGMTGGNPMEIYTWMTGMEETMVNLLTNPELVRAALDRIAGYFMQKVERLADCLEGQIDLLHMGDDLGGQQTLLISRELYRALIQPVHRRIIDHAHKVLPEAKILYHSDGAVFDILPDLIDAGVDVLEAVQTDADGMDPRRLKSTYGERLGFHGAISVQALLPRSSAEHVRSECQRLCDVLGKGGGYIAAPSHAMQAGTPVENVWAMLEGVLGDALEPLVAEAASGEQ